MSELKTALCKKCGKPVIVANLLDDGRPILIEPPLTVGIFVQPRKQHKAFCGLARAMRMRAERARGFSTESGLEDSNGDLWGAWSEEDIEWIAEIPEPPRGNN